VAEVHKTAVVDKNAEIASDVKIGPFAIIEENVVIQSGSSIGSGALIAKGTRLGKNVKIHHGAVIGTIPQDLKFGGEETIFEIGDNSEVREYSVLNRGTKDREKSSIGKNCFLMAYSHVAHDCIVGDNVILANGVQLGGHVTIGDYVIIGGLTAVHQFSLIGQHAFIGGGFRVVQDVPPYVLAGGEPLSYKGLNVVGLRRRGFSTETIRTLQRCYRLLYRSKMNVSQAVEKINEELEITREVKSVLEFIEKSNRGMIR